MKNKPNSKKSDIYCRPLRTAKHCKTPIQAAVKETSPVNALIFKCLLDL